MTVKVSKQLFDYHKQVFKALESTLVAIYPTYSGLQLKALIDKKFTRDALILIMRDGFTNNLAPTVTAQMISKHLA